jgi:hypothetical protein
MVIRLSQLTSESQGRYHVYLHICLDGLDLMLHARFVIALAGLSTLIAASSPARAQGLVTQKSLSADMSQAIIQAVVEKCRDRRFPCERHGGECRRPPDKVICGMMERLRTPSI